MRRICLLALLPLLFLAGCARQGVIVQKTARPQPFYHSLGIEGSYAFILRDNAGRHYRQLVTPEVFASYAEGDHFNDLQPAPAPRLESDGKMMLSPSQPTAVPPRIPRVAKVQSAKPVKSLAKKKPLAKKRAVARKTRRARAKKIVRRKATPKVAQTIEVPILVAQIDRVR